MSSSAFLSGSVFTAGFVSALFGIVAIGHVRILVTRKSWFLHLMSVGAVLQTFGLIFLATALSLVGHYGDGDTLVGLLLVPYYIFTLAPSLIAIACYQTLDRVIWFACPAQKCTRSNLLIPPNRITTIAVSAEMFSLLVTIVGGSLQVQGVLEASQYGEYEENITAGYHVTVAGSAFEFCTRLYFLLVTLRVMSDKKSWSKIEQVRVDTKLKYDFHDILRAIVFSEGCLAFRALFRFAILASKQLERDWMFYAFEVLPVFAVLITFAGMHPGQALPPNFTQLRLNKEAIASATGPTFSHNDAATGDENLSEALPVYSPRLPVRADERFELPKNERYELPTRNSV